MAENICVVLLLSGYCPGLTSLSHFRDVAASYPRTVVATFVPETGGMSRRNALLLRRLRTVRYYHGADVLCCCTKGIVQQMRITGRGLGLGVAKQCADNRERKTSARQYRGIGMPQVM